MPRALPRFVAALAVCLVLLLGGAAYLYINSVQEAARARQMAFGQQLTHVPGPLLTPAPPVATQIALLREPKR